MKTKLGLLILLTVVSVLISDCGNNSGGGMQFPPAQITSYTVKTATANYYDEYPGTVTALEQVEIRPEVSGYVTDIHFKDGQFVKKGEKLYSIEEQQYKAAYDVAKANLLKAQQDYDRYKELAKNDAIATQVLEHAQADLQAAESNLKAQETNLRNAVIYAPFDGTIGISQVKLGSSVTVGQTLMNTISSDNPIAVDFSVDEKQIPYFTKLLHDKTEIKDSTFTIVLPDQSIYPFPGNLILMDRAVDPQTGTITARLEFPNKEDMLKPGLTCDVRVKNTAANAIMIPYAAVTVQMGEYFVFVIDGNKVSQRKIEIGRIIGDMVIVNNGLKDGEQIAVEGVQKLRDGAQVVVASSTAQSQNSQTSSSSSSESGRNKK